MYDERVSTAIGQTLILKTNPSRDNVVTLFHTLLNLGDTAFSQYFEYVWGNYEAVVPSHPMWGVMVIAVFNELTDKELASKIAIDDLFRHFYRGNASVVLYETLRYLVVTARDTGNRNLLIDWVNEIIDSWYGFSA